MAELSGVSVRTLHHYDEIGIARPSTRTAAGYRAYSADDVERHVTAVEPSAVMRGQRPAGFRALSGRRSGGPAVRGPVLRRGDGRLHGPPLGDPMAGLREMRRVARRVVVLTFDTDEPGWQDRFWLTRDYLPEFAAVLDDFPSLGDMAAAIGARAEPVPVPWDCADGLFEAYWRRPDAYLQTHVRRAMSVWTRVGPEAEQRAVRHLRDDLDSGRWAERNGDLTGLDAADLGLRLLMA